MRVRPTLSDDFFARGFTNETDPFQHRDFAERLTKLYGRLQHGTVAILDGRWGTGKSVFARQWCEHLCAAGIPSIYFDAFASDYIESPFQAVSTTFVRAAREAKDADADIYDRFLTNAAKATKKVGATVAKVGVKIATLGIVNTADIDALTALKDELADLTGDVTEEGLKRLLEEQATSEATFRALRDSLNELPSLLSKKLSTERPTEDQRIVVVIDELDRCRPDFALGILETLKHFFRAERVHFVLVTDRSHLTASVTGRYGIQRADEYIQKFYDFIINFERRANPVSGNAATYARKVIEDLLSEVSADVTREIEDVVWAAAEAYDLTLRQVENVCTTVALACLSLTETERPSAVLIVVLSLMKTLRPELYSKARKAQLTFDEAIDFVTVKWPDRFPISDWLDRTLRYHLDPALDLNDPNYRGMPRARGERLGEISYLANNVMERFSR